MPNTEMYLPDFLVAITAAKSRREAIILIRQGSIRFAAYDKDFKGFWAKTTADDINEVIWPDPPDASPLIIKKGKLYTYKVNWKGKYKLNILRQDLDEEVADLKSKMADKQAELIQAGQSVAQAKAISNSGEIYKQFLLKTATLNRIDEHIMIAKKRVSLPEW